MFDHLLNVFMVKDAIIRCAMHKQCLLQASTVSSPALISESDDEGTKYVHTFGQKIPVFFLLTYCW